MDINLPELCRVVRGFFSTRTKEIDKAVKFVKRKSKLNAKLFVEALVLGCLSDNDISLERICRLLKERGVKITKQALFQRFNNLATELMRRLFAAALQQFKTQKCHVIDLLTGFSSVYLLDSSAISLPQQLKSLYEGFGGGASEAGLKLQVLLNYTSGQINEVAVTSGRKSDQSFKEHLKHIEKGALYLQDLGYFCIGSFKEITNAGAYFISRHFAQTTLFDKNNERINLLEILQNSNGFLAKEAWLGKKSDKLVVRLVAYRLEEMSVQRRIRKTYEAARKQGRTPGKETLELAKWSIYLSNVPENMLDDMNLHNVYALRWQIELFFKLSKSECGIHKSNGKKADRIQCELYARLISIVLLLYFVSPVRWTKDQEISLTKAHKHLQQSAWILFRSLSSFYRLMKFLGAFLADLKEFALKGRRSKKRPSTHQKLMDATGQEALS